MRQGNGTDLLGPNDPRSSSIGVIYVAPNDDRKSVLAAILTQEKLNRKQIAVVLPPNNQAFQRPGDFDDLKSVRKKMSANIIFIAPSGPGPAEFARQRRFPVYTTLDNYADALRHEQEEANNTAGEGRRVLPFGIGKRNATPVTPVPVPVSDGKMFDDDDDDSEGYEVDLDEQDAPVPARPMNNGPRRNVQLNAGSLPPNQRRHAEPADESEIIDEMEPPMAGPAAAGLGMGLAAGALAGNAMQRPQENVGGATQRMGIDDDDALPDVNAVPPERKYGAAAPITPVPVGPPVVASGTSSGYTPGTPLPAADEDDDGEIVEEKPAHVGPINSPGAISLGGPAATPPVRRRTTPIPPMPPEQQLSPSRRDSKSLAGAGLLGGGAAVGAGAMLANNNAPASPGLRPPVRQQPLRNAPPPQAAPPPKRQRRRPWWLLPLLLLLTLLLLCAAVAYAQPKLLGSFGSALPGMPGSPATLTIQPDSQIVSNSYIVTGTEGTPNPKSQTIKARTLNSTASSQTLLAKATGHNKTVGKNATGFLTFFNSTTSSQRIAVTTFTSSTGVKIRNNVAFTIAAGDAGAPSSIRVAATTLSVGTQGDIPANAINTPCCVPGIAVKNVTTFTGGQDPQDYDFVTQDDVNKVATQQVQQQVVQDANKQLTNKMNAGEKLAENPQCTKNVNSSAPVGDTGKAVESTNVTVTSSCSSVAYDDKGMRDLVTDLLKKKAQASPGEGYTLQDNRVIIDPKIQSVRPINLLVNAKGQWVYQFDEAQKQALLNKIKGLPIATARTTLASQKGVKSSNIQYNGDTLPADLGQINIVIENPQPLKDANGNGPGTSPTVTGSPVNSPGDNGTPGVGKG